MLCYAMQCNVKCYATPRYAMLCYAMLCNAMLNAMLRRGTFSLVPALNLDVLRISGYLRDEGYVRKKERGYLRTWRCALGEGCPWNRHG